MKKVDKATLPYFYPLTKEYQMNKLGKMTGNLVIAAQILAIILLAACTPSSTITFCHATGDAANPYEKITITRAQLNDYIGQPNDFYPVPANGCPTSPLVVSAGEIAICHATGSATNPYNEITVSVNGLNGHDRHARDIIPAPANGCPTIPLVITAGKITICHATSSATNPYNEITVSVNGLNGHVTHPNDIIPAPEAGCPTSPLVIDAGKITICHATSSLTNSYNEITVSVNGLNGHDKHARDIIPAPVDGCPTMKP
jgi:hypothetical protein